MNNLLYVTDSGLHETSGAAMKPRSLRIRIFAAVIGVAVITFSGWANADPPSRVGRLGYMSGSVSFSPAGEQDWTRASINRPLTTGDRLWTDERARTELQIGGAMVRMGADTSVALLNLNDRIAQLQLTQGTLNVRVRRLGPNQVFEVDTPNLAFTLRQVGEYRITVDPDGNATTIIVRKGKGEAYGEGAAYVIDARQAYRFSGSALREYRYVNASRPDEFDRWSSERDRRYDNSVSARYVSQDVIGYQDLDANGTWRTNTTYGNVWYPNRVSSGWTPYRDGHWAWIDPWGWTWVDDASWGFAVSHYGRWANLGGVWAWVPGPARSQAYYAPALVVFVGGNNFQLAIPSGNVGGVGWFPLGPREVYQPSYTVSRGYFENINISNTSVNTTVINNYYNNSNVTNVVYANREVAGAIIAVPTTTFVQSQPVSRAAVRVTREMVASAPLAIAAAIAPTQNSVRGNAGQGNKPPNQVFERPVVARTAPPAVQAGFAAQQQQLNAKPGRPLDEAARKELKPAATVPAPAVKVVAPTQAAAPPTKQPPPTSSEAIPADARGKPEQRGNNQQREQRGNAEQRQQPIAPVAPVAPPQRAAEPRVVAPPAAQPAPLVAPPAPTVQPPVQRGRSEQRGNSEQRQQPAAPVAPITPAAPPQRAAEPRAVAPPAAQPAPAAPPATTAQPPEQRGRSEQRGNAEQRQQPIAPVAPAAPPQRTAEPKAVTPPVVAPVPVAPPAPAAQQPARSERKAPPAARQVEPPAPTPIPAPAPAAARQPAPQPQAAQPRPNADKGKGQARDKATTEEELRLEDEELLRKRKNNK